MERCAAQKTAHTGEAIALDPEYVKAYLRDEADKAQSNEAFVSAHLPYMTLVADNVLMLKEGDVMGTMALDGINPMTTSDSDIDTLKRAVASIAALMGPSFGMYVHRIAVPQSVALNPITGDGFAAQIDRRWQDHLTQLELKRPQLFLSVLRRPSLGAKLPWLRGIATRGFVADRLHRIDELEELMGFFSEALADAKPRRLSASSGEWFGMLNATLTGRFSPIEPSQMLSTVASQVAMERVIFGSDTCVLLDNATNERRVGAVFNVKTYPAVTRATMLDGLTLPVDVVLTNSFSPIARNLMAERIQRIIRQMRSAEDAAVSLREQLEEAADDQESGRVAFGDHHLSIAVYARSEAQLEQAAAQVKRIGQDMGAVIVRERMALKASYFAQAPGNFSYRPRRAPISTVNFADFSALHGATEGRGAEQSPWGETVTVLPTAGVSGYRFNFHERGSVDSEPTAGHTVVLGTMGAGKTFTTAFLVAQAQRVNARLFFFDKDQGLEMSVRALGGTYRKIKAGIPTGLEPLRTETDLRGQAWLSEWLGSLISKGGELSGDQSRSLQAAIRQNAEVQPELQTFRAFEELFRHLNDGEDLQDRISEWAPGGRYGWVFAEDAGEKLSVNADIAGFDMTELLDLGTERMAVLSYLFRQIERVIEDRRPTIIVLDEAWQMLNDAYFAARLEKWLVTLRKMNCVVVMMTQLPSQLEKSAVGKTIVETASTQILFPNPKARPEDYSILKLGTKEAELLVQPTYGQRIALVRSDGDSVVIDADLTALGSLAPILGGGPSAERLVGPDWRNNPDFWRTNS